MSNRPLTHISIGDGFDLTIGELRRTVAVVAEKNAALGFHDPALQQIETTLDTALIDAEQQAEGRSTN